MQLIVTLLLTGLCVHPAPADEPDPLTELLTQYFKTAEPAEREKLASRIAGLPNVNPGKVHDQLAGLKLWPTVEPGKATFHFEGADGHGTDVAVRVPDGYTPDKSWPLIVALHWMDGKSNEIIQYARKLLGEHANEFLIAAPQDYRGFLFQSSLEESEDPVRLLAEIRHRFRIDSSRVYVVGYSMGGHAAFSASVLYRDLFSGSVIVAGTFAASVYEQERILFVPNLGGFPMMVVWGSDNTGGGNTRPDQRGGIAGSNQRLKLLVEPDYPMVRMIELPGIGHMGVEPDPTEFYTLLSTPRPPIIRTVAHWFRYPTQGRRDWLRVHEYSGKPWNGTILKIQTRPGEDVAGAVISTLKRLLAYLGGSIEGQRITIESRHLKSVEVLFFDDMIDLNQPVEIILNGKNVPTAPPKPDIGSMLDFAYNEWEFQRVPQARLVLTRTGQIDE